MTTNDQRPEPVLARFDHPVAPDAAFAACLRARFLVRASNPIAEPVRTTAKHRPQTRIRNRHRIFDLAAVAVLVLSMIGGLVRSTSLGGDPATPFIHAPEPVEQLPVHAYWNDHNSGSIPPADSAFDVVWEMTPPQAVTPGVSYGQAKAYGDVVFRQTSAIAGNDLIAYDLLTGDKLWQKPVRSNFSWAATDAGVVMSTTSDQSAPEDFAVVLLDSRTGEPRWTSQNTYSAIGGLPNLTSPRVAGETIYFVERETIVVALELASGTEKWRFDAAQGRSRSDMLGACTETDRECVSRLAQAPWMVLSEDQLFFFVPVSVEVVAISMLDGQKDWVVPLDERLAQPSVSAVLRVTDFGLFISATSREWAGILNRIEYQSLWSVTDGSEIWQRSGFGLGVSIGSSLFVIRDATSMSTTCCTLGELDMATGDVLGERAYPGLYPGVRIADYYPESDTLALYNVSMMSGGEMSFLMNISDGFSDPVTLIPGCISLAPVVDTPYLLCDRADGSLAVYEVRD